MAVYCVANLDIVGSRLVSDRGRLQKHLLSSIEQMNQRYSSVLAAPITMTLGDEWQFITHKPSVAYDLVHEFQQLLWQANAWIYAGMGIGGLSTPVYEDVRQMDGPCFHAAREALQIVKENQFRKKNLQIHKLSKVYLKVWTSQKSDMVSELHWGSLTDSKSEVAASTEPKGAVLGGLEISPQLLEETINLLIENNEILKMKMSDKQRKVYIEYNKLGSYRKIVSNYASESIGGISQKLNNAAYFTIMKNHRMVAQLIETIIHGGE